MQLTSPSRRALGLLAAGTLGLSSAVLGTGVAQAAGQPTGSADSDVDPTWTVPEGTCTVEWVVTGARGGADDQGAPAAAPAERTVTTIVSPGDVFTLAAGTAGAAAPAGVGGTTSQGEGAYDGAAGSGPTDGGGGAASVVMWDGYVYLWADGSAGAGSGGGAGGTVADASETGNLDPEAPGTTAPTGSEGPGGRITATGYACDSDSGGGGGEPAVPLAPIDVTAVPGDGELTVSFSENYGEASVHGWEYQLDGGDWTPVEVQDDGMGGWTFTLDGLDNGRSYTVRVRGVNDDTGAGEPSAAVTGTPFAPIGALRDVAVSTGPSALDVSWGSPVEEGTFDLAGYKVIVVWSGEQSGGIYEPCDTDAATFECYAGVPAGDDYVVHVVAIDSEGNHGETAGGIPTGVVPFPAVPESVPAADAPLEGVAEGAELAAGETVTVRGDGFLPNSTVQAVVYSTPTPLGSFTADAAGAFEIEVTIPEGLHAGEHSLVVSGLDPSGNPRHLRVDVTVAAAEAVLAYTGAPVLVPALGGLAAIVAGSGLLVASRRRPTV